MEKIEIFGDFIDDETKRGISANLGNGVTYRSNKKYKKKK